MTYRGHWGRRSWQGPRATDILADVGGIDSDVEKAFLSLSSSRLAQVFAAYAGRYGAGPAQYARRSYEEWKEGTKRVSGKTLVRLLEVVPPVLPFDQRLELVRTLRNELLAGRRVLIDVLGPEDLRAVDRAAEELIQEATSRKIPSRLKNRLAWLSMGDAVVGERLLAEADRITAEDARRILKQEMQNLERLYRSSEEIRDANHRIALAGGILQINFKRRRWWMSKPSKEDKAPPGTLVRPDQTNNLLQHALQRLEGASGQAIIETAQREALRLQVEQAERQLRRNFSQEEMDDFISQAIRTLRQVDTKMNKVTMRGEFQGGTGRTEINVQSRFCFVATAVYGSPDAPEVAVLRRFREETLRPHVLGRAFITSYEWVGPHLARAAVSHPRLRRASMSLIDAIARRLSKYS